MYVVAWMYVTRGSFGMVPQGKFVFKLYEVILDLSRLILTLK